jgi:alpha-tubulin suppressor-like RCC1 family protein
MIGMDPSSSPSCPGNDELGPLPCVSSPTQIQGLPDASTNPIIALRLAEYHACALAKDETVWCWGFNDQTNLGQCQSATELQQSFVPLQIFLPTAPTIPDGGVSADGGASVSWTSVPSSNPLSTMTRTCAGAPLKVVPPNTGGLLNTITVGGEHTCVLEDAPGNPLLCWGENTTTPVGGQAGQDFLVFPSVEGALQVVGSTTPTLNNQQIVDVRAGDDFTCLKTAGNTAFCWGGNQDGELASANNPSTTCTADGTTPVQNCAWSASPTVVELPSGANSITIDDETACAIAQGEVSCWGNGSSGIFQNPSSFANQNSPTALTTTAKALFGGSNAETYCYQNQALEVFCWGANNLGQCASPIGATTNLTTPTLALISNVSQLEVGVDHGCAITTLGELYCWGDNSYGELGIGKTSTTPNPVPQKVPVSCH